MVLYWPTPLWHLDRYGVKKARISNGILNQWKVVLFWQSDADYMFLQNYWRGQLIEIIYKIEFNP